MEELHVLITVEDSRNRAELKLKRAVEEVKKLLVPAVSFFLFFCHPIQCVLIARPAMQGSSYTSSEMPILGKWEDWKIFKDFIIQ